MNFTVDGRQAFAYTAAHELSPAKPTVVFVHGAGYDHSVFGLQSRYFGYHGRNVLALDLPAHGRSEGPALASVEAMADWVVRLLDAARLEVASLVGHSMGSLVALEAAARHPRRVERLALVGTTYPMKVSDALLGATRGDLQDADDMLTVWGHSSQAALGANPNPGMSMYGESLARLARLAPGVLYTDLHACHAYASGESSVQALQCPVLFVLGRRDQMTPAKGGLAFAQTVRNARVVQVAGSGHSLMTEAPDELRSALADFLA